MSDHAPCGYRSHVNSSCNSPQQCSVTPGGRGISEGLEVDEEHVLPSYKQLVDVARVDLAVRMGGLPLSLGAPSTTGLCLRGSRLRL